MVEEHTDTILAIRVLHRDNEFAIKQQVRSINSVLAHIRTNAMGWSLELPALEREAIENRARKLVAAVEKGKPVAENDTEIAEAYAGLITTSALSRAIWDRFRKDYEKRMVHLAKTLPAAGFVEDTNGFGLLSFARIIGEAGDLSNYPKPGHLWKRMGMAVLDGVRQGGLGKGASADDWTRHGYKPSRRAKMFVIGESLLKADGPYRRIYLARLPVEHAKAVAEGLTPATTGKSTVESWEARGLPPLMLVKKLDAAQHRGAGHMATRAQRYMEKRLLRDLWRAWRRQANEVVEPTRRLLAAAE